LRLNTDGRRLLRRSGRLAVRVEFRIEREHQPALRVRFRLDLRVWS
jgi:hypothetical protein